MGLFSILGRVSGFKRHKPDAAPLYAALLARARVPHVYAAGQVADTFEGRFEYLALVVTFALLRLEQLGQGGQILAQALVDRLFLGLDDAVRQVGTSDIAVGKKVKKLARHFYGRAEAYRTALAQEGREGLAFREVVARNLYGGSVSATAVPAPLLAQVQQLENALGQATLAQLAAGEFPAACAKAQPEAPHGS